MNSAEGAAIAGRNGSGDYSGIVFSNLWPGERTPREYRLRRDRPDLEHGAAGQVKERGKYLSPPGRGNLLYLCAGSIAEDTYCNRTDLRGNFKWVGLHYTGFPERADEGARGVH